MCGPGTVRVQGQARDAVACALPTAKFLLTCSLDASHPEPLTSLRVLDIGCGGGILAESLARQGAQVAGVDVNEAAVGAAEAHALQDQLVAARLQYRVAAAEQLVQEGLLFDAGGSLRWEGWNKECLLLLLVWCCVEGA